MSKFTLFKHFWFHVTYELLELPITLFVTVSLFIKLLFSSIFIIFYAIGISFLCLFDNKLLPKIISEFHQTKSKNFESPVNITAVTLTDLMDALTKNPDFGKQKVHKA